MWLFIWGICCITFASNSKEYMVSKEYTISVSPCLNFGSCRIFYNNSKDLSCFGIGHRFNAHVSHKGQFLELEYFDMKGKLPRANSVVCKVHGYENGLRTKLAVSPAKTLAYSGLESAIERKTIEVIFGQSLQGNRKVFGGVGSDSIVCLYDPCIANLENNDDYLLDLAYWRMSYLILMITNSLEIVPSQGLVIGVEFCPGMTVNIGQGNSFYKICHRHLSSLLILPCDMSIGRSIIFLQRRTKVKIYMNILISEKAKLALEISLQSATRCRFGSNSFVRDKEFDKEQPKGILSESIDMDYWQISTGLNVVISTG